MTEISLFSVVLVLVLAAVAGFEFLYRQLQKKNPSQAKQQSEQILTNPQFIAFQRSYFIVYFCFLLSDWLNAPYHYKVYNEFNYLREQIAVIYVCGYIASVLFSPIALTLPERYGRRTLCCAAAVVYFTASLLKCCNSYLALLFSRIFSATSTRVLFSACESWYIYEHLESYDFPSEWVSYTLESTSKWNGWFSLASGLIGYVFAEFFGFHAYSPSILAAILLLVGIFLSQTRWRENRGSGKNVKVGKILLEGLRAIFKVKHVFKLGLVQALFEGVVYIFVFLWTPTLLLLFEDEDVKDGAKVPIGIVFATFMAATMIGAKACKIGCQYFRKSQTDILLYSTCAATASMLWLSIHDKSNAVPTYFAFIIFELACGAYFPAMAMLRSKIIPQKESGAINVWVRVPLNMVATAALIYLHNEHSKQIGDQQLYMFCTIATALAVLILLCTDFGGALVDDVDEASVFILNTDRSGKTASAIEAADNDSATEPETPEKQKLNIEINLES